MSQRHVCDLWNPGECEGTDQCPPRCPRYVAPDGRSYTVYRLDDRGGDLAERTARRFGRRPDGDRQFVAVDGDSPVGVGTLDGDRGTVDLAADADPVVGTELGRHLVAHARTLGGATLTISGRDDAIEPLVDEVDATVVDEGIEVDLRDEASERTTRSPARRADYPVGEDFSSLFAPDRVAVVGATDREGAIGRVVVENLLDSFDGEVIPVTSRTDSVLGIPAVDDVAKAKADLAVVVLPADAAVDAVLAAGESGVETVAVLSAGFGETDEEGSRREQALRDAVEAYDLTLVGPNALGVVSTRRRMNASFAPEIPDAGGVSVLSHSGALITATLDWATARGIGVRDVVSVGNGVGIDEADLLRYWGGDPETDVVFAYLEDVSDGRRFVEAAREVSRTTPVVVLKSGRSEAGARAAASHTGAIVGDDAGFDAAFEAAGVVRADSQQSAYDLLEAFARQPLPHGDRVAVVTNAGGPGVLATDAVAGADVSLAALAADTRDRLAEALPDAASVANPLDVLGDATVDRFADALDAVLADGNVDAAVVVSTPHPLVDQAELVRSVGDAGRRHGKPVVTCLSGGPLSGRVANALADAGVPNFPDADRAADALATMAAYARTRTAPETTPTPVAADADAVDAVLSRGPGVLGVDAMDLLEAYGIPTPASSFATTRDDAVQAAASMDGPVAMKVASPDLPHKTDAGGVRVGVEPGDVGRAFDDIVETVRENAPEAAVRGVLVQRMVDEGVECVVGVTRHPRFGPVLTFGLGGVFVEHLEDVAHGLAPLSTTEASELIHRIDGSTVLDGARGDDPVDEDALADALVRVSWLAADHPELAELEVNPLVATTDGVAAVDLHATLGDE